MATFVAPSDFLALGPTAIAPSLCALQGVDDLCSKSRSIPNSTCKIWKRWMFFLCFFVVWWDLGRFFVAKRKCLLRLVKNTGGWFLCYEIFSENPCWHKPKQKYIMVPISTHIHFPTASKETHWSLTNINQKTASKRLNVWHPVPVAFCRGSRHPHVQRWCVLFSVPILWPSANGSGGFHPARLKKSQIRHLPQIGVKMKILRKAWHLNMWRCCDADIIWARV